MFALFRATLRRKLLLSASTATMVVSASQASSSSDAGQGVLSPSSIAEVILNITGTAFERTLGNFSEILQLLPNNSSISAVGSLQTDGISPPPPPAINQGTNYDDQALSAAEDWSMVTSIVYSVFICVINFLVFACCRYSRRGMRQVYAPRAWENGEERGA